MDELGFAVDFLWIYHQMVSKGARRSLEMSQVVVAACVGDESSHRYEFRCNSPHGGFQSSELKDGLFH